MPYDIMDNHARDLAPKTKEKSNETRHQNEQAGHGDGL
jgi:hypothetical protein